MRPRFRLRHSSRPISTFVTCVPEPEPARRRTKCCYSAGTKKEKHFLRFSRHALLTQVKLKLLCQSRPVWDFGFLIISSFCLPQFFASLSSLLTGKIFRRGDRSEPASPQANHPTPSPGRLPIFSIGIDLINRVGLSCRKSVS